MIGGPAKRPSAATWRALDGGAGQGVGWQVEEGSTMKILALFLALLAQPAKSDAPDDPSIGATVAEVATVAKFAAFSSVPPPKRTGVVIVDLVPGGPAEQAGLELGDIIYRIGTDTIDTGPKFGRVLRSLQVGELYAIWVRRLSEGPKGNSVWKTKTINVVPERRSDVKVKAEAACPLRIVRAGLLKGIIGTPEIVIEVKNRCSVPVVAFQIDAKCFNRFNDPVRALGIGRSTIGGISQETIKPGDTLIQRWPLYVQDTTARAKITITRTKRVDGREWSTEKGTAPSCTVELKE